MRFGVYIIIAGTFASLTVAACGFPAIVYLDETTGGAGGSGGGAAGDGGAAGMGGSGGQGGAGGAVADCAFDALGSCGPGEKCALLDEDAGPAGGTHCIPGPAGPPYSRCTHSDDCEMGLFCNRRYNVCQPVCQTSSQCKMGGSCYSPRGPAGKAVPGVKVCGANCVPDSGYPCKQDNGFVSCFRPMADTWECGSSNGIAKEKPCTQSRDCAIGQGCFGEVDRVCRAWCTPASDTGVDASCPLSEKCYSVIPTAVFHDTTEFGLCL